MALTDIERQKMLERLAAQVRRNRAAGRVPLTAEESARSAQQAMRLAGALPRLDGDARQP